MNSTPHLPTRKEIIEQCLVVQIEKQIDDEVYKWMETKQTKFKYYEKEKFRQYAQELITFLNTFKVTNRLPTTFREVVVWHFVSQKISIILERLEERDIDTSTINFIA